MNYLAIDTSGANLTIVLCIDNEKHTYHDKECGVNHSVALMPKIQSMALENNFDLSEVDFFACVVGAGSFTGIRIAVSTIKAFCFAYKKPCLSITSFDTLAYNKQSGKTLAVIDAKHNGFYVCGYQDGEVVLPPEYINREKLTELAKEFNLVASWQIEGFQVEEVSVLLGLIKAVDKKQNLITNDLESLIPLYVRKSQAEEGR